MAKYKGIIWSDARGKVNGIVYSRNTFGTYVRALAAPVQPETVAQQKIRAKLQNLSRAWRNLTQDQRNAWNALAAQVTYYDPLGNPYHPTGEQLFCGLNMNRTLIGQNPINIPPATPVNVPTPGAVIVSATGGQNPELTVAWQNGANTVTALVYATGTISNGRNFIRPSEFRLIKTLPGGGGTPASILEEWRAKYGEPPNPPIGKVAVRVKLVDTTTGFAGGTTHGVDTW